MAAKEPHGVPTYPVWVGSLKETVKDNELKRVFSKFGGSISSCKVMRDAQGKSKKFGYVNYLKKADAERVAKQSAGTTIQGVPIRTKGPSTLQKEGFWGTAHNFRPLTDCAFFIEGQKCSKGKSCLYRHSKAASSSTEVCPRWKERRCSNIGCSMRHPGGLGRERSSEPQLSQDEPSDLTRCGGRCGDVTCAALFASSETLTQHIQRSRMPNCRFCGAIFLTVAEYQEHMQSCLARGGSGSTDTASQSGESVDIEVLSDSESETSLTSDLSEPGGERGWYRGNGTVPPTAGSPAGPKRSRRSGRSRQSKTPSDMKRGSVDSTGSARRVVMGSGGRRRTRSGSAASAGSSNAMLQNDSQMEMGQPPNSGLEMEFLFGDFDEEMLSDSDDEVGGEDGLYKYSTTEMARLLSLNEEDMIYDSEGEEEEEGAGMEALPGSENGHGTRAGRLGQGERGEPLPENGVLKKTSSRERKVRQEKEVSPLAYRNHVPGRLEPVGVFWDIENCRVPPNKSAFSLANKMRAVFFKGKREAEFMCVCDITKESKEVIDALHNAQVTLVHVNAIAKNAADDKLRQSLRRFAHTYPAPSTVVLISGDVNFSTELNDLQHIHNITVILVHNSQASDALKVFANTLINYDEFLLDVEAPREAQRSNLPRIVFVSGLPVHLPPPRLSSRLGRISDNCGGRVISVHQPPGTARVLFRTPEWAVKAQKRMNGEDVFGQRIACTLEHPPPPGPGSPRNFGPGPAPGHMIRGPAPGPNHGPGPMGDGRFGFRRLSGQNLAKTFPPVAIATQPQHSPPIERRPPYPPPPRPPFSQPCPPFPPSSNAYPSQRPLLPTPRPPPPQPSPPSPRQAPRAPFPPPSFPPTSAPAPYPQGVQRPHPPFEGKILIFKIPPVAEEDIPRLSGHVVSVRLAASVKAQELILWHDFMEMQVLLRVDFLQTAIVRREEMLQTLYNKGQLRPQLAQAFMKRCADSIAEICRGENLPWDVTVCGWTEEEEEDRITRSNVVGLLRRYPSHWAKWSTFKQKYCNSYTSGISEMAIHNACRGAVQILGSPAQESTQVIVFYALSPLIRVDASFQPMMQKNIVRLLSSQPDKKLRLLDFVRAYRESFGGFPTSSSSKGKPLQDILRDTPKVNLIGTKPSSILVTLSGPDSQPRCRPPASLADIAEEFKTLLSQSPNSELKLSNIQQEYQTFYHRSFRVSDFIATEGARMRELLDACPGIMLREVALPGGKTDVFVSLETEPSSAAPLPKEAVERFKRECIKVLSNLPDQRVELNRFPAVYQREMGEQLLLAAFGAKKLVQLFQAIPEVVQLKEVLGADGKSDVIVCLETERPSSAVSTAPLPKEAVERFKRECIKVLSSLPDQRVELNRFPAVYQREMGEQLLLAAFGAKKLVQLFQAIPEVVQLREVSVVGGKTEVIVCLEVERRSSSASDAAPLSKEAVERFKQESIKVLAGIPSRRVELARFPAFYKKELGRQFVLASFGAKKLTQLFQAIPEVVQIQGDKDKYLELLVDTQQDCARRIDALLCSLPNYQISLDRFMYEYEKKYGGRLTSYYGHQKLINLLEDLKEVVEVAGTGPSRSISLHPTRAFAYEMTQLLSDHPTGLPINKIVPTYKEKFHRDFVVTKYGFPKLIRALEAVDTFVELRGEGPTRVAHLKSHARRGSLVTALPANQQFQDEMTALLFSTHTLRMSVPQLTKTYNAAFRHPANLPPVGSAELIEALRKIPTVVKLSGAGPTQCVQLIQRPDQPSGQDQQQKARPGLLGAPPIPKSAATGGKPAPAKEGTKLLELAEKVVWAEQPDEKPLQAKPTPVSVATASTGASPVKMAASGGQRLDDDAKRLSSETHRLLLSHREHAMTLAELVECFRAWEDPAAPSAEELYSCVRSNNIKAGTKVINFQISYIPGSVGDSIIQLNAPDCIWKLSQDLLYLFVFRPTPDFTMPLDDVLELYAECYGHKLVPAVYQAKSVQQVMKSKQLGKVIKFDPATSVCALTESGRLMAMAALLAELLFLKGEECRSHSHLPQVYRDHFGVPLPLHLFGVTSIISLLSLPNIVTVVELSQQGDALRPVLTTAACFAEQLRYLLTRHNGRIPLRNLESIYVSEFGKPKDFDISRKVLRLAPHVVNLAGQKWAIWAPAAHSYPPRGSNLSYVIPRNPLALNRVGSKASPTFLLHSSSSEEDGGAEYGSTATKAYIDELSAAGFAPNQQLQGQSGGKAFPLEGFQPPGQTPSVMPQAMGGAEIDDMVAPLIDLSHDSDTEMKPSTALVASLSQGELLIPSLIDLSHDSDTEMKPSTALVSSLSQGELLIPTVASSSGPTASRLEEEVPIDLSPYGFLAKELGPELMAELTSSASESTHLGLEGIVFQADAFRELFEQPGTSTLDQNPTKVDDSELFELPECGGSDGDGTPGSTAGPSSMDFMEANMSPDEVLQELQKVKVESGGTLDTESLDPFLSYFGELSSRELERLDSLNPKPKPNGAGKRKRVMAIRFPGQSPPPVSDPYVEQYKRSMEVISRRLPEAPDLTNLSNSSEDGEDGCPKPFVREEYVKKAMEMGMSNAFTSSDEEELLGGPLGGGRGSSKPSIDTLPPPKPLSVESSESAVTGVSQYSPTEPHESAAVPGTSEHGYTARGSNWEGERLSDS